MADLSRAAEAARRAASVLLRGAGARSVMLRIPAPAIAGDASEQLGLAVPQFQDVELAPVVFRATSARTAEGKAARRELLVSATAIETLTGSHDFASTAALFASAFGVLVDQSLLAITSATELTAGDAICGYRLQLHESTADTL
ncbi:hypothetical protein [Edaphobacter aggregans]|uniref:hypothetical protein n=1 Tax=Edaphobacter aggregans TaxID=570835 RepID=UPI0012F7977E|nr:hypothetical protein [Edaphobacter aggregans]